MATTVYDELQIELQNGKVVTLRPLPINKLKKFMTEMSNLNSIEEDDLDEVGSSNQYKNLDVMLAACKIAIGSQMKEELEEDPDILEEILDLQTMWKIIEVCGGVEMSNPNQLVEVAREAAGKN